MPESVAPRLQSLEDSFCIFVMVVSLRATACAVNLVRCVGGDTNKTVGWDGGVLDKCCGVDSVNCRWYSTLADCTAAAMTALPMLCAACGSSTSGVNCPSWGGAAGETGTAGEAVSVTAVDVGTATPLLRLRQTNGEAALGATVNAVGDGTVVVLLAPDSHWLGVVPHLVARLGRDTAAFTIVVSGSTPGEPGVQLLSNRTPTGCVTLGCRDSGVVCCWVCGVVKCRGCA